MHARRTAEDILREEYFDLLPRIRRATEDLETEVRYLLMPVIQQLASHERVVIRSRVKECESAIASLKRRNEPWDIDEIEDAQYSLKMLNDLAGVRVLAFPKCRVLEIDASIRARFQNWNADPVPPVAGSSAATALKYHGLYEPQCEIRSEIQVMSMLVGLFWEIEHAALYKPGPELRGMEHSLRMQVRYRDVLQALAGFEAEFESETESAPAGATGMSAGQATADFKTLCGCATPYPCA